MIRAFIIKVDVQVMGTLQDLAVDIEHALEKDGIPVESVAPWRAHGEIPPQTPTLPPNL